MFEVQIKKATDGYYKSRYKRPEDAASVPFAAAKTRQALVMLCEKAGMRVVTKWS